MWKLRETDRRVAARAWKRVRRPSLPAWGWLIIDVLVLALITRAIGELVTLVSEDLGHVASLIGLVAAIALAIYNFLRTTRPGAVERASPEP